MCACVRVCVSSLSALDPNPKDSPWSHFCSNPIRHEIAKTGYECNYFKFFLPKFSCKFLASVFVLQPKPNPNMIPRLILLKPVRHEIAETGHECNYFIDLSRFSYQFLID